MPAVAEVQESHFDVRVELVREVHIELDDAAVAGRLREALASGGAVVVRSEGATEESEERGHGACYGPAPGPNAAVVTEDPNYGGDEPNVVKRRVEPYFPSLRTH